MKVSAMNLRNLSIKRKIMLIAMLTSSIAIILSSVSLLIYDLVSFRRSLQQDLRIQAEIIAYNSAAAMAFGDDASATETLSSLRVKEDIVAAMLYDADGRIFARYFRASGPAPDVPELAPEIATEPEGSRLEVSSDVKLQDERLGTLLLQSDLQQWNLRARRYASILGAFVLVSSLIAWLVSKRLQIVVSRPVLRLEEAMQSVSLHKNYAIRATKVYDDEIGRLIDGFNTMLAEIQNRDKALQRANEELKEEIAHRRRAQEELLKAKRAAEDASHAKSAFLANMSHELRTPLNAIIGYSEMLEEESQDSGNLENVQDIQRIQAAGKHLLSLINDVLDLSKIEAGKMTLHLENFDLEPMIQEITTTLKQTTEKKSNRLDVKVAGDLGPMCADMTKVRQILFNLLSNACKFTEHGTITLEADKTTMDGQDWMRLRVTDTGIGMTPKEQRNLFKEFSQADASIARKYGGTGLGLAISARFAQMMNGWILVDSESGKGSTFTVLLPAIVMPERSETEIAGEDAPDAGHSSESGSGADVVLVIDDDPAVRDLMSRSLMKLGFHVLSASSGIEGLRLALEERPQIITLDVMMPGLNGWNVLSQLKANPELAKIPVIMVTIVDNEVLGFDLGASNYMVKPVDRERLAVLVDKHRTKGRPAA